MPIKKSSTPVAPKITTLCSLIHTIMTNIAISTDGCRSSSQVHLSHLSGIWTLSSQTSRPQDIGLADVSGEVDRLAWWPANLPSPLPTSASYLPPDTRGSQLGWAVTPVTSLATLSPGTEVQNMGSDNYTKVLSVWSLARVSFSSSKPI